VFRVPTYKFFGPHFARLQNPKGTGRRLELKTAMAAIRSYERPLAERRVSGVASIPGITVYGITDLASFDRRAPTVVFTLEGYSPRQVAERLGEEGIFVWDLRYYYVIFTCASSFFCPWTTYDEQPVSSFPFCQWHFSGQVASCLFSAQVARLE
jgi:hypothetical protein